VYNGIYLKFGGVINLTTSSLAISPSAPGPGSIFSISFILTNQGTTSASAVTATVLPEKGFTAFGTNPTFIGNIGVSSQSPVTVSVTASNTLKAGSYTIPIRLNYYDSLHDNVSTSMNVTVRLGAAAAFNMTAIRAARGGSGSGGLIVIVLVVIIIVLAVLYWMERKKHHGKQADKQ
jgi:hypothetical protein